MRILKSLHGRELGLTPGGRLMAPKGVIVGEDGSQFAYHAPDRCALFDDFLGATISTLWGVNKGSDGAAANFAVSVAKNGMVRATTGAGAGASMAVNGVQLHSALNWQADAVGLVFEARVKLSAIATIAAFIGLTDQTAALEAAITGAGGGNGITTNATDAVGFLFDTTMTTKDWWLVGVANDVDAATQDTAFAPVAATYEVFRIEIDATGKAVFFRNGLQVGVTMAGALTPTIPLTPVVTCFTRAAGSATVDADYIHVSAKRV